MKVNKYGRLEPAIGEVFELDGERYRCMGVSYETYMNTDSVCDTYCNMHGKCSRISCIWWDREDRKEVLFQKL